MALVRRVMMLRGALLRERPDAVLSFLTKANVLTLAATFGTRLKVIVSESDKAARQEIHPLWSVANGLLLRRANAVVEQTKRALEHVPATVRRRARVIPHPIETPPGLPLPYDEENDLRLVAVGQLTREKGFDLLIDAFNRIAVRQHGWTLDIWGEGPERRSLQAMIKQSPFPGRINLRGSSGIHGGWTEAASAFVLPSRFEGFPEALGEAMAAGLPAIAFDCPYGPRELIRNGHDGILVERENIQALARAMDRLMSSSRLRRALGENAAHSVKRFAPDRIARHWESLVAGVAGTKGDSPAMAAATPRETAALVLRP